MDVVIPLPEHLASQHELEGLVEEVVCMGTLASIHVKLAVAVGQHHDFDLGMVFFDILQYGNTRSGLQVEIKDHDIGQQRIYMFDSTLLVRRITDYPDIGKIRQHGAQAFAHLL